MIQWGDSPDRLRKEPGNLGHTYTYLRTKATQQDNRDGPIILAEAQLHSVDIVQADNRRLFVSFVWQPPINGNRQFPAFLLPAFWKTPKDSRARSPLRILWLFLCDNDVSMSFHSV
jgi:hypothetical protein